jgi:hypothetical protein
MLICLGLLLWLAIALAAGLFLGRFLRFGLKGRDAGNRSVYVRFTRRATNRGKTPQCVRLRDRLQNMFWFRLSRFCPSQKR